MLDVYIYIKKLRSAEFRFQLDAAAFALVGSAPERPLDGSTSIKTTRQPAYKRHKLQASRCRAEFGIFANSFDAFFIFFNALRVSTVPNSHPEVENAQLQRGRSVHLKLRYYILPQNTLS